MRFDGHIGCHDYEGSTLNMDEQQRLVGDLGEHNAMILRNLARSLVEAAPDRCVYGSGWPPRRLLGPHALDRAGDCIY